MASVVIIGHAMSGKSHLACMIAGFPTVPPPAHKETCGTSYIKADINGKEWHIWDTPRYQVTGWTAYEVVDEADIIIVCHDGLRASNPFDIIDNVDADKCVIVYTRHDTAGFNLSWRPRYFSTLTSRGQLVPIVPAYDTVHELLVYLIRRARNLKVDLVDHV